jgi:cytochrome c
MRSGAFILAFALALAACGQPSTPAASPRATATEQAPSTEPTPDVIASRISALPSPYNLGDYQNGQRLFAQCRACHTIGAGEPNRVGPHLHEVIGRQAGSLTDFRNYSEALKTSAITWDTPTLDRWIADPREVVAETNMIYPGLSKPEDRRDLVAYIAVKSGD